MEALKNEEELNYKISSFKNDIKLRRTQAVLEKLAGILKFQSAWVRKSSQQLKGDNRPKFTSEFWGKEGKFIIIIHAKN